MVVAAVTLYEATEVWPFFIYDLEISSDESCLQDYHHLRHAEHLARCRQQPGQKGRYTLLAALKPRTLHPGRDKRDGRNHKNARCGHS